MLGWWNHPRQLVELAEKFHRMPHKETSLTDITQFLFLNHPDGREIFVEALGPGQFFGEMALLQGGSRQATVRAAQDTPVDVVTLNRDLFFEIITQSEETHQVLRQVVNERSQTIESVQ